MEHPLTQVIRTTVEDAIQYARTGEKLVAAVATLVPATQALQDVIEIAPELAPEIAAAVAHLSEAGDAIRRASDFQDAEFDVRLKNRLDELDIP